MNTFNHAIEHEIAKQKLPTGFIKVVSDYYQPLAESVVRKIEELDKSSYLLLGVQGTQGSGKSTCAEFLKVILESQYNQRVVVISIDDFYLTLAERQKLAKTVHPLFITRGVPGTHDIALLDETLQYCADLEDGVSVPIPIFDKATDDRARPEQWQVISDPVDVVILEGWCVGLTPQAQGDLEAPVNQLEALEDSDRTWRKFVNRRLSEDYAELYAKLDCLVTLQAPSFDCVFRWRLLQEQKLADKLKSEGQDASKVQTEQQLSRFISHYQRLTQHALLTMPNQADWSLILKEEHGFSQLLSKV